MRVLESLKGVINTVNSVFLIYLCCISLCSAENMPKRVIISADSAPGVSRIIAYLELFDISTANFLEHRNYSAPLSKPVDFLREYYQQTRSGDLQGLLKFYSPDMRPEVSKQLAHTKVPPKHEDGQYPTLKGRALLYWDDYRLAVVDHQVSVNSDQWSTWSHTFKCTNASCLFVKDQEWSLIGNGLTFMYFRGNGSGAGASNVKFIQLEMHPNQTRKGSLPITLDLAPLSKEMGSQLKDLFERFLIALKEDNPQSTTMLSLFDNGLPTNYSRLSPTNTSGVASMYSWHAFQLSLKNKTGWKDVVSFRVTKDNAIYVARSNDGENLILAMRKINGNWKLLSYPPDLLWWQIIQTRAFNQAVNKLVTK
jgi:hypothetical protein